MPVFLPLHPGIYRDPDGSIVRVRLNKTRTSIYTQTWRQARTWDGDLVVPIVFRFEFDPGKLAGLTAEHRMPLDEARRISREVGQCLACAKILSDPKSQAAGIGPSCAKRWTYDEAIAGIVFGASPEEIAAAGERAQGEHIAAIRANVAVRLEGEEIVIFSDYDDLIVSIIKTFEDAWWDRGRRAWLLPREHALALADAFALAGIAHDDPAAIGMGWTA